MRITKFEHACVRLEHDGTVVVIDPGVFTRPEAVAGADAVLITHQHPDHLHLANLAATDAAIFTIDEVAEAIRSESPEVGERVTVITPDQTFDAGVPVRATGWMHAVIHPELPRIHNSGYVVSLGETKVYHPGDALTAPGEEVDVLCLPVSAPWLKAAEAIDFAREVAAPRSLAIHDKVYSEAGLGIVDGHLQRFLEPTGQTYTRVGDGDDVGL